MAIAPPVSCPILWPIVPTVVEVAVVDFGKSSNRTYSSNISCIVIIVVDKIAAGKTIYLFLAKHTIHTNKDAMVWTSGSKIFINFILFFVEPRRNLIGIDAKILVA